MTPHLRQLALQQQTRRVFLEALDSLIARIGSAGTVAWYLTDRLGSVRDITDNTGTVQDHINYDGFGNATETNSSFGDRYKWTGRELESESGLQYNRARYYDPKVGRWISQDPLGFAAHDMNLYRYSGNSTVDFKDPTGLDWPDPRAYPPKKAGFEYYVVLGWWWTKWGQPGRYADGTYTESGSSISISQYIWNDGSYIENSVCNANSSYDPEDALPKGSIKMYLVNAGPGDYSIKYTVTFDLSVQGHGAGANVAIREWTTVNDAAHLKDPGLYGVNNTSPNPRITSHFSETYFTDVHVTNGLNRPIEIMDYRPTLAVHSLAHGQASASAKITGEFLGDSSR